MTDLNNKWLISVFREHPALIISALYLIASVIGMFFAWAFLREFGINVFNYSQISHFLIASLKEPLTWAMVVFAVVLVWADNVGSEHFHRRTKSRWLTWYGSPTYRFINNFVAIAIVLLLIVIYADYKAKAIQNGGGKLVSVTIAEENAPRSLVLLGTTGQFVFLLDRNADRVVIHPFENVQSIAFQAD